LLSETGFRKHQILWLRQVKTLSVKVLEKIESDKRYQYLSDLTVGKFSVEAPNFPDRTVKESALISRTSRINR